MRDGTGLGDTQRTWIGIVFSGLIATNASLAGLAAANAIAVNPLVYMALGLAAVIIYAVKDQMGIRDATSAAVAKTVDPTSDNKRDITDSINTPPGPPVPPVTPV